MNESAMLPDEHERWLPVAEDARYRVSNQGRVRGPRRMLKPWFNVVSGYPYVSLGRGVRRTVHSLVVEAFVRPVPPGMEIRHLNGDPRDCRLLNLSIGTTAENAADRGTHGTNGKRLTASLVREIRARHARGVETYASLAGEYGVSKRTVQQVVCGKTWAHIDGARTGSASTSKSGIKPWAKLTEADVREIRMRLAAGEVRPALSREYGVSKQAIGQIASGRTWKHVA